MEKALIIQKLEKIKTEVDSLITNVQAQPETTTTTTTTATGGSKKALIVGINKYDPALNADLNGCVNDSYNIINILTKFGFDENDMNILRDYNATKANILAGLDSLVSGVVTGDQLVFYYSGHGSQVRDIDGDEISDNLDEIICPTDLDWNDPLTDDILAASFKQVPEGAQLTFVCDSCNSGGISGSGGPSRFALGGDDKRFLEPPPEVQSIIDMKPVLSVNKIGQKAITGISTQRHILFAASSESSYSYEGNFNGKTQGAFTWNFCKTVRGNPTLQWSEYERIVRQRLASQGYPQEPQLISKPGNFLLQLFGEM